jgi:putative ABC transport system permease protein
MPGASYLVAFPLRRAVDQQLSAWRLGAAMFLAFGALAVLVAAVGLYGVIAYDVAQRTRDLGVRVALGARGRDVVGLVLREGVRFAALGTAIGLAVALTAGRLLAPLLFRVSPSDPAALAGAAGVVLAVAVLASLLPAWRAARVDPAVVLRAE